MGSECWDHLLISLVHLSVDANFLQGCGIMGLHHIWTVYMGNFAAVGTSVYSSTFAIFEKYNTVNCSINHSINQLTNKSANQSIDQSFNQSINRPIIY